MQGQLEPLGVELSPKIFGFPFNILLSRLPSYSKQKTDTELEDLYMKETQNT